MQRFANVSLKFLDHCEAAKGHSSTVSSIMPHDDARMRGEGTGSRWTSKSPQWYRRKDGERSRTAPVCIREAFCKRLFEPFSSLGIIWTAPWRFYLSMCSQDKHTAQWHRKVGEPGFWFPCCGKEIKKLGTIAAAKIKNKKMGKWKAWDKWMCDLILISGAEKRQKKGEISTVGLVKSPTWILV